MIAVKDLVKNFGPKTAVGGISFKVERGEVLGFLGPNGAGKSTSMRMITGFLPPTAGTVTVCGFDVSEHPTEARSKLGYLPENAPVYGDMSVHGFLGFCAELRGLFGEAKTRAIDRVVELCFLGNVIHQSVDTLSKGFRHRTCLAQALIHDPEVLILDEPTDGLDPNQKHEVRSLIRQMGQDKAIIFSTHILEEVEAACTKALIIDQGKIVAIGTPDDLKARAPLAGSILLALRGVSWPQLQAQLKALRQLDGVELLEESPSRLTVRLWANGVAPFDELVEMAHRERWHIEYLSVDEGRLDDVFRSITLPENKIAAEV
ncbi:MAG: ATP-binding cassette domain-containing protein [Verrucomicrobia bacterium]|nr:ATP-binding cassette domain-containing protein [Verrucomicrobiota bacterium]